MEPEEDMIDEDAQSLEIVIRYTSGPTAGMLSVASFLLGHLGSLDAEFAVKVRKRNEMVSETV